MSVHGSTHNLRGTEAQPELQFGQNRPCAADVVCNLLNRRIVPINGPEDLRETTRGADIEAVQLKPGKLQGSIKHFGIGNLEISQGRFSSDVRLRGILHRERVVLGTILDSAGLSTQWWKDVQPRDIGIFPALAEFDAIHCGGAAYLTVSILLPELLSMLGGEEHLADPAFWNARRLCRSESHIGAVQLQQLVGILSSIDDKVAAPSDQAADFLQRSILEYFVMGVSRALPQGSARSYTGARLVSETEDYLDAADGRPVHISELCSALKVSRRSLHRAFAEALGMGPVAYLRRRRLSAVHSVLRRRDSATVQLANLPSSTAFPRLAGLPPTIVPILARRRQRLFAPSD
jgi:AraC family ethanolamine operon transcriptional activator